ncbi:universal stress protein [Streptomyces sp. CB01881]|uniref:universal stress protein n=1 Tax=Streptomyces sp. CB01881 TaxID=2078691 RepID=UPI0013873634|nr:universal stress protein [Streptomyces sp. CB01881]
MTPYVMAAVDGSPQSLTAARWAADEAVRRGLHLRLVHARTWEDDIDADPGQPADVRALTTRMLMDARQEVSRSFPGLEIRAELIGDGVPADVLAGAAATAELLVLGSRGLGGFDRLLLGSVGQGVAARCDAPVVLVRASDTERTDAPEGPKVVVGIDTRAPSDAVIDFAFREAAARGAVLHAVHGWEPPPVWGYAGWVAPQTETEQFRSIEAELLSEALTGWREKFPDTVVVEDSRIGTGAGAVVDASTGAALTVVGRRRRPHPVGLRLGPVAHAVIHHAQSPVAVVPHD